MLSYATLVCCIFALILRDIIGFKASNLFINIQNRRVRVFEPIMCTVTPDTDISKAKLGNRISSILKGSMIGREEFLNRENIRFPSFGMSREFLQQNSANNAHDAHREKSSMREVLTSTDAAISHISKDARNFIEKENVSRSKSADIRDEFRLSDAMHTNKINHAACGKFNDERQRSLFRVLRSMRERKGTRPCGMPSECDCRFE